MRKKRGVKVRSGIIAKAVLLAALLVFHAMPGMGALDVDQAGAPFDIIIRGGTIVDGTGQPGFAGDIAIRDDRIEVVGSLAPEVTAHTIIDAQNSIVSPGFIDIHTHADSDIGGDISATNFVMQGTTTVVGGNCGYGPYPPGEFLASLAERSTGPNFGLLVGHGTIRQLVMGMANRPPTPEELEQMKALLRQAMEEGALGLSSGLEYTPGYYADLDELVELCRIVAEYNGFYASHVRDQSWSVRKSWHEIIATSERARVRATISHAKVVGKVNQGASRDLIAMLHAARDRGVTIYCDAYPYEAGSTTIVGVLIPQWVQADGWTAMKGRLQDPALLPGIRNEIARLLTVRGGGEAILIIRCAGGPSIERRYLSDIASQWGIDHIEAVIRIVVDLDNAHAIFFNGAEADQAVFYSSPYCAMSSDSWCTLFYRITGQLVHPRNYGTMAKFLGSYVREWGVAPLEQGIRQMTSLPAEIMGINDRGVIAPGMKADVVVFDYREIADSATYMNPHQYPRGISYVIINGKIAVAHGVPRSITSGVVIRGHAFQGMTQIRYR